MNMIFHLTGVFILDLRDISGQTHCFCFGTREIVVIILITSASLFLYDGLQVNKFLPSAGHTGKTYSTQVHVLTCSKD